MTFDPRREALDRVLETLTPEQIREMTDEQLDAIFDQLATR